MRRILACLLVLSMMLAFSACQNTKPAGTPDEPSVPAEPVEPVQPDEPAQPDTPEQPSEPDAPETPEEPSVRCLPLSYQTNRYYGMFDEGMKSYVDYPRIRVDGEDWPALADALDRLSAELYDDAMDLAEDLDELPLGDTLYSGQIAQTVTRADRQRRRGDERRPADRRHSDPPRQRPGGTLRPVTGTNCRLQFGRTQHILRCRSDKEIPL